MGDRWFCGILLKTFKKHSSVYDPEERKVIP
jgi:hypothetical protein